jgi:histidinol dehydrogenase
LPTGGSARFASPLGAYDFLKRTSIIEASAGALAILGPDVARLARMEGFEAHARSIELREAPQTKKGHRTANTATVKIRRKALLPEAPS